MKYIKLAFIVLFMSLGSMLNAQNVWVDVIQLKSGRIIKGIILEEIPNETIKIHSQDGELLIYPMSEIAKIAKERLLPESNNQNSALSIFDEAKGSVEFDTKVHDSGDMCRLAAKHANKYYYGEGSLSGLTIATTLLVSPIIGLIPAAVGSNSYLKDYQLNYPNAEFMKNSDYARCYQSVAQQIKQEKAWKGYAIGTGIWLAGVSVLTGLLLWSAY